MSSTELGLEQPLTREQAAAFFYRCSNTLRLNYSTSTGPAATAFYDYDKVGKFAQTAMTFCTMRYLINGDGHGYLKPKDKLTRAEAAQLLYNLSQRGSR